MPKELHEISQFVTGTVTTPTERDISDDAASDSLNIDPVAQDGLLKGIPKNQDVQYNSGGGDTNVNVNADNMAVVTDDTIKELVYFDDSDNKFKKLYPLGGTLVADAVDISSGAESVTGTPAMEVNNQEVHIGMGKAAANKPLWVGHVPHGQFGGSVPSGLQIEDAELKSPTIIPDFHKPIISGSYIYGFEYRGNVIYKLKISDYSVYKKEQIILDGGALPILTAWCKCADGSIMAMDISNQASDWGTNTGSTVHGNWLKFSTDSLKIIKSGSLTFSRGDKIIGGAVGGESGGKWHITDIHEKGNMVWMAGAVSSDGSNPIAQTANTHGIIYALAKTNFDSSGTVNVRNNQGTSDHDNASYSLQDRRTTSHGGAGELGYFRHSNASSSAEVYMYFKIPRICLVEIASQTTRMGLLVDMFDYNGSVFSNGLDKDASVGIWDSAAVQNCGLLCIVHEEAMLVNGVSQYAPCNNSTYDGAVIIIHDSSNEIISEGRGAGVASNEGYTLLSIENNTTATSSDFLFGTQFTYTGGNQSATDVANITMTNNTYDIDHGQPVFRDNGSNVNIHMFAGNGNGRWMDATNKSSLSTDDFTVRLESDLNISPSNLTYDAADFDTARTYYYRASYLYDGYQESPLGDVQVIESNGNAMEVSLQIHSSNISKRISAIVVYLASSLDGAYKPDGFYRHLGTYKLDDTWDNTADLAGNPDWGAYEEKVFVTNGNVSASYEARNGLSEIIDNTIVNYGLSTQLNNQLFVADCYHPKLSTADDDITNYIYKSRPYNFDQFNYLIDFLPLPTKPLAIKSFMGRIYAFDENNGYRIEPNSMYIEDVLEGVGCVSQKSIFANDYGMCFVDDHNIYLHDGRRANPIGDPILRGNTESWQGRDTSYDPIVTFDAKRQSFLIFFKVSSKYWCWSYNVFRKRFDLWSFADTVAASTTAPKSAVLGPRGQVYISETTSQDLTHFMGHTSQTRTWDWESKKMHMRQNTGDKKFKNVRIIGSPSGTLGNETAGVYAKVDDTSLTETGSLTDFTLGASQAGTRGKQLQIFLAGLTGSVDAIGAVFRRFILLSKAS